MSQDLGGDPFAPDPSIPSVEPARVSALAAWIMSALTAIAFVVAIVGRLFPLAVALDLVALWPLPAIAVLIVLCGRWLPGSVRLIAPALLVVWPIIAAAWWSVGSPTPPSAAADVVGPSDLPASVALAVEVDGELVVGGGGDELYTVTTGRRGGAAGAPDVLEAREAEVLAMGIVEREDSAWFRSSGWTLRVSDAPVWEMHLVAPFVDLDLRSLRVRAIEVLGDGTVLLPRVAGQAEALVSGALVVSVPADVPVEVVGDASVPAGWTTTDDGSSSPTEGEGGWVIVVEGPGVELVDR